jgi:acyl-CoA dehydrogenase
MIESTLSLTDIAEDIGANVAAPAADEVDREARFPHEAVEAMRERGLLSALVPVEHGGPGATVVEVAAAVRVIARHCAASALVLAMHAIELSNLVRNGTTEPLQDLLRSLPERPLLFANANSEVGIGGDVGRSRCAIETVDGSPRLVKEALAISYGENADIVCATARRSPESEETDQAQAICRSFELEALSEWDSIGLRGTCSRSFRITAQIDPDMVYPVPFSVIGSSGGLQSMLVLLSSVWVGLADAAAAKAHAYVRAAARRQIGSVPKSAARLAELSLELDRTRDLLDTTSRRFDEALGTDEIDSPALLASLRNLKIGTSEGAVAVAKAALEICGIAGYKRDTPFSLDRQLRDALGGLVMVSNDRYMHANAEMLIARKQL